MGYIEGTIDEEGLVNSYDSTLIKGLRQYGLDCLIPERMSSYDDDEGIGHIGLTEGGRDVDAYTFYEDGIERNYDIEYEDEPEPLYEEDDDNHNDFFTENITNLDELMLSFGFDDMDREDFLNMEPWQLFRMNKRQFNLIDFSYFDAGMYNDFLDTLATSKEEFPAIEQRIKWAIVSSLTNCKHIYWRSEEPAFMTYPGQTSEETDEIINKYVKHLAIKLPIGTAVNKISLYSDYIRFLPDALEVNAEREALGIPLFRYALKPKTSHLKDLHDKAYRDHMSMDNKRKAKNIKDINKGIKEMVASPIYRKYLHGDDNFAIIPPKDYDDFQREGRLLNHCIGDYASRFAEARSLIYFLRRKNDIDKPFYSIELCPPEGMKGSFMLTQCYTYGDSIEKDDETLAFIIEWCREKNILIRCDL